MACQNLATELNFNDIQIDDIFAASGVMTSLKKYEKFIEVYVNDQSNQVPLPQKISKDRVVGNGLIRAWAAWTAPPLLLVFICGGLPPNGDVAVRVREIARACILAAPLEYHQKRYGEVLNIIIKMGGAINHLAADKRSMFHYIQTYLVDTEVLRNEASTAVSEMEQDKDNIRFDLSTPAIDVVNDPNFFNMNVVANNVEVPYRAVATTRTDMWYTVNQDYYNRMPNNTSPTGDHSDLLTEAQLQKLCGIMYDFAKQVTYNREVGSSPNSGNAINIHQLAVLLKSMPEGMDHPHICDEFLQGIHSVSSRDPQLYLMERV